MKGDDAYTPQHNHATRLARAYRENTDRRISAHFDQNTDTASITTQAPTPDMAAPTETSQQQQPATAVGDVFQCTIEKFNGTTGITVGDFIRNVEADGKPKNLVGDAFNKHCVALARNQIDLTKSKRVYDVTRLVDVQPDHSKDWNFVKDVQYSLRHSDRTTTTRNTH